MERYQNFPPKEDTVRPAAHTGRILSSGRRISANGDCRRSETYQHPITGQEDVGTMDTEREKELHHLWQSLGLRKESRPAGEGRFKISNERRLRLISSQDSVESRNDKRREDPPGENLTAAKDCEGLERSQPSPTLVCDSQVENHSKATSADEETSGLQASPCYVAQAHRRLVNLELRKKARRYKRRYPVSSGRSSPVLAPSQIQRSDRLQQTKSYDTHEPVDETVTRARELMERTEKLLTRHKQRQTPSSSAMLQSEITNSRLSRRFVKHGEMQIPDMSRSYREKKQEILESQRDVDLEGSVASSPLSPSPLNTPSCYRDPIFDACNVETDFPEDEVEEPEHRSTNTFENPETSRTDLSQSEHENFEQDDIILQSQSDLVESASVSSDALSESISRPSVAAEPAGITREIVCLTSQKEDDISSAVTMPTNPATHIRESAIDLKKKGIFVSKQLSSNGSSHGATLDEPTDEKSLALPPSSTKPMRWNVLKAISIRSMLGGASHSQHGSKEASAALTLSTSHDISDTSGSGLTAGSPVAVTPVSKTSADKQADMCVPLGPNLLLCRKDKIAKEEEWYLVKEKMLFEHRENKQSEEEQMMEMVFFD